MLAIGLALCAHSVQRETGPPAPEGHLCSYLVQHLRKQALFVVLRGGINLETTPGKGSGESAALHMPIKPHLAARFLGLSHNLTECRRPLRALLCLATPQNILIDWQGNY